MGKNHDIKRSGSLMAQEARKSGMVIVATRPLTPPALFIYSFYRHDDCRHFRDQGKDVIVVMDDRLTHAKFYREYLFWHKPSLDVILIPPMSSMSTQDY